jgi:hypothetical protein
MIRSLRRVVGMTLTLVAVGRTFSGHSTVVTKAPHSLTAITVSAVEPNNCSDSFSLAARGTYSDGSTEDITSAVEWTSSNPGYANVDPGGRVTLKPLVSNPSAVITASMGGHQDTFSIDCPRLPR